MELNNWPWHSSSTCRGNMDTYTKNGYDRIGLEGLEVGLSKANTTPRWRSFWRKIMKEKKKMFHCSPARVQYFSYDPYTYSQNFDQGTIWSEPENISRSFSARFAVPCRIYEKNGCGYVG